MKPVVTRLYAVLVALTLVGLAAWAGADWYQLQQRAQEQGRATLRQTAGWISELTIRHTPLDAATLGRLFAASTSNGRWRMLLLSSSDRGTEFYKGPRPPVPVDRAVPRWEANSLTEVKVVLPVFRTGDDPLVLEGITEFYGRQEVFSLLKACGITLVVLLVLTTLVVIFSARSRNDEEETEPAAHEAEDLDLSSPPDIEEPFEETIGTIPVETDTEDEYWFDDNLTMEDLPPLQDTPPPKSEASLELEGLPPLDKPEAQEAPTLFSPASGLGWESFLTTRLSFELERASSQNQDLALVLFAVKGGTVAPEAWGDAIREAFASRDLNFEHEGGAAVVLPGRTLEQALKAARGFVENAEHQLGAVVHAGVAARAGRLMSAETLLAEAASAQRRSLAGSVRVLGLKTDPDRYRDYLANSASA